MHIHNISLLLILCYLSNINKLLKVISSFSMTGQEHSNRFIIFGTHQNIEMLRNSQIGLDEGTFKSVPAPFAQVHVIHSLRGGPILLEDGHLLPCLFVLLPNKTEAAYLRMWCKYTIFV